MMDDTSRTYMADHELATLLRAAASGGVPLRVKAYDETFVVHVESEEEDIWAGYDPAKVRAALREFGGSWSDLDADEIKDRIYRAREEGSRLSNRP